MPPLPEAHIARPTFKRIVDLLLADDGPNPKANGMGGCGKTVIASAVCRNTQIRRKFDAIGFVTLGQTPTLMDIQQELHVQLVGEPMKTTVNSSVESQLRILKGAATGKNWLIILDDVWEAKHEQQLEFLDFDSPSRIFVTTRYTKLPGVWEDVTLELLTEDEAQDLLLQTAMIEAEELDDPGHAAAQTIVKLCGYLPIFVSLAGQIIQDYLVTGASWQTEVVKLLQEERTAVLEDQSDSGGGSLANRIVGSALDRITDKGTKELFLSLSVCPEDTWMPFEVVILFFQSWTGKQEMRRRDRMQVRKAVAGLLDRNLLLGNTKGCQFHDVMRDFARGMVEDQRLRKAQRKVVSLLLHIAPPGGWQRMELVERSDEVGAYVAKALSSHMKEGYDVTLDATILEQDVLLWLTPAEGVGILHCFTAMCAAPVIGADLIQRLAAKAHDRGNNLLAGFLYAQVVRSYSRPYLSYLTRAATVEGQAVRSVKCLDLGAQCLALCDTLEARCWEIEALSVCVDTASLMTLDNVEYLHGITMWKIHDQI